LEEEWIGGIAILTALLDRDKTSAKKGDNVLLAGGQGDSSDKEEKAVFLRMTVKGQRNQFVILELWLYCSTTNGSSGIDEAYREMSQNVNFTSTSPR